MILVEVRSEKLHTAGEPHPAPSWDSAKVAFGKLCVEHNVPDEDGYEVVWVANWNPETGTSEIGFVCAASSAECRELYSPAPSTVEEREAVEL